jgi:hypothetical protein
VEYTPTVLLALARQSNAKTCASLMLECARERVVWTGAWTGARHCSRLLRGMSIRVSPIRTSRRKPSTTGAAHVLLPLW